MPDVLAQLVALVGGLVLLTVSSDRFVLGSARLAASLRVSPVLIGALVIGFGTSAPEMFVSTIASLEGHQDLAVGNVVGSNLANLSLVLAVACLIAPMHISTTVFFKEAPLAAVGAVLFGVAVQGGITRGEGVLLLCAMALAVWLLARGSGRGEAAELVDEVQEFVSDHAGWMTGREIVGVFLGLVGTLVSAQVLVWGAQGLAETFGATEGFVGLTLVAVGTSLPELFTSIHASRRGEDELVVGNLLGSNVFNSLAVGGLVGTLTPGGLADHTIATSGVVGMIFVSALAIGFMFTGRRVVRSEAMVLMALYLLAVPAFLR